MTTAERYALRERLRTATGSVPPVPIMPEAIFGKSRLVITHEASGYTIVFDAEGALTSWLSDSLVHGSRGLTVPAASLGSWSEKRDRAVAEAAQSSGDEGVNDVQSSGDYDWTYTTQYDGADACDTGGADSGQPLPWRTHEGDGIDIGLLRRRDEPILLFTDLPFYSDDLHDHGDSALRLRLRVMPSCFFILHRHYLRVDGVLIQQRDARYFHKFGRDCVLRARRLAKAPLPPLQLLAPAPTPPATGGATDAGSGGGMGGADVAGLVGPSGSPVGVGGEALPDEARASEILAAAPAELDVVEEMRLVH